MTTSARGRHRKLRRNILHTVIATALLAGTFTAVDQSLNIKPAAAAAGEPGTVDTTFSATASLPGGQGFPLGIQSDGNIIVGIKLTPWIKRLSATGTDLGFTNSTATTISSGFIRADDTVISGGTSAYSKEAPVRKTGSAGGQVWASSTSLNIAPQGSNSIAELADGSIIVGSFTSPFLHKFNSSGALDTNFQANVALPANQMPTAFSKVTTVKSQTINASEKILIGGMDNTGKGFLRRYNLDGTLDLSFTTAYIAGADTTGNTGASNAMNLIGSGANQKIIVAFGRNLRLFNADGTASTGTMATNVAAAGIDGDILDIAVDNVGRIVYTGWGSAPGIYRLNADGTKDTLFNANIASANPFSGAADHAGSLAIDAQNNIIAGGAYKPLVRILGDYANPGPAFSSAAVSADGLSVTLDFSVALGSVPSAASAFAVTRNGVAVPVSSASVSGNRVTLALSSTIGAGQAVTVAYTAPARDDATTNAAIQTTAGGDALNFNVANDVIVNNSTADKTRPIYTSAALAADGVTLTLAYNEPLNATTAPTSAFTVTAGTARTVSAVAVSGSQVVLTLAAPIGSGVTTTVTYNAPTSNEITSNGAIEDVVGNDAVTITNQAVANSSTVDKTSPIYTPASAVLAADGVTLTLTYNEPLNATTAPTSAFTVTAGTARTVTAVAVSGSQVVLTLSSASAIGSGVTTTVTYTAPTPTNEAASNSAVQDTAGNDAVTITNQAVTNNSTVDRVSPTYTASSATVATDGMSLTLTYNEALSSVTAPASAFAVVSGGIARTITSVATDGAKVILYFASPLSQVATTTVSYTAPAIVIGTSNSAIQDIAGNDAISLPLQSAVNNSTVDATGPSYTAGTAVLDSTGMRITMTYSEALNARTADPSAFTVTSGVSTRSVTDVTVSGSTITLTLASPIAAGASATVSYAAPTSSSLTSNLAVQDVAGNDGVSLSSIAITNNSTVNFALAPNLAGVTAPTTTKIVLSFDKTLNATTAATTDFVVTSAGTPIAVTAATVVGSTVELTLASAMSTSYQTFVTYTAPTSDATTANSAIQSSVGNDAASFDRQAVDLLATGTQITEVVSSPTVSPGQKIDLIARMPFTQTGSTSQEIVQQIDPSVIQLTGINDIAYPNGWTLSYCSGLTTDCTVAGNFSTTAPTTAAEWALVKAVKATGNVISDGTSGGNLIATATATDTSPRQGTFTPAGSASGDGWMVDFDNRGNVYNMYHHDGNNNYNEAALDCHTRSGADCAGSWPFYLKNYGLHSNGKSYIYVDKATNKIYFPTTRTPGISTSYGATDVSMGVACIDVSTNSTPRLCGESLAGYVSPTGYRTPPAAGYVALRTATYTTHKGSSTWAINGTKIYLNDLQTGRLSCFDYSVSAACAGQPYAINGVTGSDETNSDLRNIGGLLYGSAPNVAFCFDPTTNTACTGWETSIALPDYSWRIVPLPNASGTTVATCFLYGINATPMFSVPATTKGARCYTSAGAPYTTNIGWLTTYLGPSQGDWFPSGISNDPEVNGTKIYWSNNARFEKMRYFCWDVSLNAGVGGECPNFPIVSHEAVSTTNNYVNTSYTLNLDPLNSNCLWVNNDRSRITTYDAITGQLGCTSPPSTVTFSGATTVPRLSCTDENGVRAWRNVTLRAPGSANYTSVKLTVVDSSGNPISGYTDLTATLTNGSGQRYWDLSALPVSITGQNPNFKVQFIGLTATTDAQISISAEGGSPQLCLTPVTVVKCPTGLGVLDQAALVATATTVTGSGSSTVGGTTTPLTSSTSNLSVSAPSIADCSSSLRGRAGYSGNGGTGDPVAGATVRLLNSSGQPVLDAQNNPITTVTGADGRYAFDNLYPGSYQVTFQAPADKTLVSATTVSGATGSTFATTSTDTSTVTATTSAVAVGTFAVVNSLYMVAMTAKPDTTTGLKGATQTVNLITNPDASGTDVPSEGSTVVADSVRLCDTMETSPNCTKTSVTVSGVGSYSVDANGLMTFIPEPNYTGTPTALAYIVMDTAGGTGASTYTPTVVGPPTATANTTSGPLNVAQSVNVLTNDTPGGSNGTFVTSSLTLSCPTTPTTPTCSVSAGAVTIAGQGTYTKAADGTVTFTPVTNYSGTPTPVKYTVTDSTGQSVSSTYTPTIIPPPTVRADTTTAGWDVTQSMNVITSATVAGTFNASLNTGDTAATGTTLKPNSLTIDCASAANCTETVVNGVVTEVIMAGQGTYTVDPATNVITFNPVNTFTGTARPVTYSISDELNQVSTTTYTPTVNPPTPPTADPETTSGPKGAAQTTDLLVGDATSAAGITLDPTSVRLCPATTTTPQTTTACNLTTLTVPGVGTYVVVDGVMTFTPEPNYVGTPPPVVYQVTDSVGGKASSTYTPTIIAPPTTRPDTTTAGWDVTQSMNVVTSATVAGSFNASLNTGDSAATGTTLKANSLTIDCASAANCTETVVNGVVTEVIMAGQGTYTVDPATNTITFSPVNTFTGTARPVTYSISDELNQVSSTTYTPTVTVPPIPTASPDTIALIAGGSMPFSSIFDGQTGDSDPALAAKGTGGPDLTNASVCLIDPATSLCDTDGIVAIAGEGTYTLDPTTGIVTYASLTTATEGAKTPVTYQITDGLNRSVTNTLTPTIYPKPTADDDISSGAYDTNQTITPFSNDDNVPSHQLGELLLCGNNPVQTPNNCDKTSVTTADGVYTVVGNTVVFNPDPDFVGQAIPVRYQAKDDMNQFVNALITPTVLPPAPPTADPETTTGRKGAVQSTDLLVGDATSDPDITLVPTSVRLCPATTTTPQTTTACNLTTLSVPGVGTYTVVDGVMTFTPEPNYVGTPPAVVYQVTDSLGGKASSTYTPTVIGTPTALADTTTGGKGLPQNVNLLTNPNGLDSPATGATLDPTSVKLCDPNPTAEVAPDCTKTSVTVAGVGTYSVDSTGKMTFTPDSNYVGTPPALSYTVTDSLGSKASSTYTPTVIGTPTATADTSSGPQGVAQSRNVVTNTSGTSDAAAPGTNLVSSTVTLSCASAPNCTRNSDGTVTIADQGTYSAVAANGTVVFTPTPTFTGTATPVTYTVSDALGQSATTTYTPTVIPAPVAINDTSTNGQDINQLIDVLNNDTVPTNPPGDLLNPTTVKLCGTNPAQSAPNCTLTTLTTPDGTYSVNQTTGVVTFDPIPSFTGTVSVPVRYQVSDSGATPQITSALITPTVIPGPTAFNDTSSGPMNTAQTKTLVTNDSAASGATLNAASVKLCATANPTATPPVTAEVAPNCTKTSVTVPNVGTYSVDSSGVMTFTPVTGYSGTPAPLSYTVTDNFGVKATATYTPTIIPPPTTRPDTTTAGWDVTQSMNVVTSATVAGSFNASLNTGDSAATGTTLKANSLTIDCASATNCTETVNGSGVVTEVIMAGQGTYTVNTATNVITFNPVDTFTGTARPVTYTISDELNQVSTTTYTPTVTVPPAPTATPDTVELIPGQSKVFSSIFDGATGDSDPALATKGTGAPDLTNASVCLLTPGTTTCDADGIVTIPGEGTYTLNPTTGIVTYAALSTATPGAKTPITYKITDGLNRSVTSTLTPTITPPPVANPDFSTGVQGAIQTLSPVGNDRPGGGASTELFPDTRAQIPSGVFLCAANQPPPDCAASTVTVTDPVTNATLGVLTVAASGLVTFTPEPNFVGTTPPIGYQIPDNLGQKAYSTITITVVPPPAPSATIDTGSAEYNKPVTLKPWINDSAGSVPAGSSAPAPSLIATSIKLCGDNSTFVAMSTTPADCTATKVKTVEGTYEVNATTGEVTFTPNPNMIDPITGLATGKGFVGTVKYPPTYQIWNNWTGLGGAKSATALLVPTIAPPGAPAATVDITKTKPGTSVVLNPVSNDTPGTAALDPTSIRLCGTGEISPACTQMSVTTLDGLYVVEPTTGQVTFTPREGFTGQATIPYVIKDGLGMMANANLIITVEDTAVVPVAKKTKVGLAKTGGTRPDLLLLLGLVAIAAAGGLRVLGRKK